MPTTPTSPSPSSDGARAVLRISLGAILLTHGLPKLLHTAHGAMADPMANSIRLIRDGAGLPFAEQLAVLVMLIETAGAVLLMLGLGTRAVACAICAEMIGIAWVLGPTWPWLERGIEYPVLMGAVALSIVLSGGGAWSLDARWIRRRQAAS
ncbi:DoxX family protein [Burkholderia gladioli]|uniref:DoxX family protein n=1 Tax=Burkholderia gladioli TaxID=28095 RepID=A0AB38TZA2_BURGA|nr:DoxX family protein [Burkholderia gladioli]KKJ02144.1 DoxX family protein [Burkholderia gladioli]MBA1364924.1 DoxX family protein [Burkholderia gladioli]MBU9265176.1 DoxX family protein [Burkholderia gladioli]MBU9271673.1 DoxX family protein [Burkholderia gladioli]MDN7809495.1 DoxX family protein [Burkholderia gladioli]